MLQKVIVVLLGFIVSVVGALSPSALFAASQGEVELAFQGSVKEETLATVNAGGQAFARVPALWVEVDGRRVTEDAWGTGDVRELRFKVGVRDVEGLGLIIGDRLVPLNPTDVITVRMFRGDFAYRDVSVGGAFLQLQGAVKTTMLSQGDAGTKIRTEVGGIADPTLANHDSDDGRVAYVVLDTGKRVDTLAVESGGRRLFTEEASSAAQAMQVPGNLLAKWVKINGKAIREYTWGEGPVERIEFEPAAQAGGSVVLAFDGKASEALAGQRVMIEDFLGVYTAYPVAGDHVRLGLDGYAAIYSIGDDLPKIPLTGSGAPIAAFDYSPANPRTTDVIQFSAERSTDDGVILFMTWDFHGESTSIMPEPTHRFRTPGNYSVTLKVTDDDLQTSTVTREIVVRNADPVPDFDFSPKIVTSDTVVTFTNRSSDPDNRIVNLTWEFPDGTKSYARNPSHRFEAPGNAPVTLTVVDELGASASITKLLIVRNAPPVADFTFDPVQPQSQVPIRFLDNSSDRDGNIVEWSWDFGDGNTGTGSSPLHSYARPGVYTVTLLVKDDKGDEGSTSERVSVVNRPAVVDFVWAPNAPAANTPVVFRSESDDPDGAILHSEWRFSHLSGVSMGASTTQSFPRAGEYWVNLSVIDSSAERSWLNRTITVESSAPVARASSFPNPALRDATIKFRDLSSDPDGDTIVAWDWDFGDGTGSNLQNPSNSYPQLGSYTARLTVTDASGKTSSVAIPVSVLNGRPVVETVSIEPGAQVAQAPIWFNATATDPDARTGDQLTYSWKFSDETEPRIGQSISRTFPANGEYEVELIVRDSEGGASTPRTELITVDYALPVASFVYSPAVATTDQQVQFTDTSTSANGAIVSRLWQFGDGTSSTQANPSHRFTEFGTKNVRLTVTDEVGKESVTERNVLVNARPRALFEMSHNGTIPIHTTVQFVDRSSDADGFIADRTWDFGDGTQQSFSSHTDPVHTFSVPGPKTIRLTTTDNHGATHVFEQRLRIENRAPLARWTTENAPHIAGEPVSFRSLSYDPDNTPIMSWEWEFGDGQKSTIGNVTHVYNRSGEYLVSLRVHDGDALSPYDRDSFRLVRVAGAHPITVSMDALHPNGSPIDLDAPDIDVTIVVMRNGATIGSYSKFDLSPVAPGTLGRVLDVGGWARGDVVMLRFQDLSWQADQLKYTFTIPSDAVTSIHHTFQVPVPLVPSIAVDPGESQSLGVGDETTPDGTPIYRDMAEAVHGTGRVMYRDGLPASGATVRIEMRHVPLDQLGQTLSGETSVTRSLLGWCEVGRATTIGNGDYSWTATASPCHQLQTPLLPGVYEVRAHASHSSALSGHSAAARFIVDPTGIIVPALSR